MNYYVCSHCGNIIVMIKDTGVPVMCCGQPMDKMTANTSDGAFEKHVPVIEVNENEVTVRVGSVDHPMLDVHYIEWIAIETKQGHQIKYLKPGQEPKAVFTLTDGDELICATEHCNLHGLWKKDI
ncbi:desulfoferrodoxin family protein [Floccifex sp.]|uniref:desulfoferrodoxin family protein n=1 Tax=Floccifex sp. TaxID=2815810 RepID=UPI003F067A7D